MKVPFDIDEEFANTVETVGGDVLDRTLNPKPPHRIADYVFRSDGVIAELKRVQTDFGTDEKVVRAMSNLYRKLREEKREDLPAIPHHEVRVSLAHFPPEFHQLYRDLLRGRIQRLLKEANKQIRETRDNLGPASALGLVLLCFDEGVGLTLRAIGDALNRCMRGKGGAQMRSVNHVICFSETCMIGADQGTPSHFWAGDFWDDRPHLGREFVDRLRHAWFVRRSALLGVPTTAWEADDAQPFLRATFHQPPRSVPPATQQGAEGTT